MITTGILTWESEIGPRSRFPHWPGGNSGATIGPGFDIGMRSEEEAVEILVAAGVGEVDAGTFCQGAGLRGDAAKTFVEDIRYLGIEITMESQERLFELCYAEIEERAIRIGSKDDVVRIYGSTRLDTLHPAIWFTVVDFFYRGDATGSGGIDGGTRRHYHPFVVANDIEGFAGIVRNRSLWPGLPGDRFERRVRYLQDAIDSDDADE